MGRVRVACVWALVALGGGVVPLAQAAAAANTPPSRTYGRPPGAGTAPALTRAQTASDAPAGAPGLDVSNWQRTIQWSAVARAGYRFAMLKASEGITYVDPYYRPNRSHAETGRPYMMNTHPAAESTQTGHTNGTRKGRGRSGSL